MYNQIIHFNVRWLPASHQTKVGTTCLQDTDIEKSAQEDKEAEENEEKIRIDDPEVLARARAMDEYKDLHRRGWGNRANRS